MNLGEIEMILKKISIKMLDYVDGDLLLISDNYDEINNLKKYFKNYIPTTNILNILSSLFKRILKGEQIKYFENIYSSGIDLLSKIINYLKQSGSKKKKLDKLIEDDISKYEKQNKKYLFVENIAEQEDNNSLKVEKEYNLSINSESFKIFIVEAEEKIVKAQDYILNLEKDMKNKELLNNIFRIFHTIKGECGFLKLASLGELSHNLETLLDLLRNDEIENNSEIIDIILDGIDYANSMLAALKVGNITVFNEIDLDDFLKKINEQTKKAKTSIGEILKEEGKLSDEDLFKILQKQKESSFTKKFGEIALNEEILSESELEEVLKKQKTEYKGEGKKTEIIDPIIKVKASQINFLVDMIGELLIAENQLEEKDKDVTQIKKVTREIQMAAMQLRTVKINSLFINMKRLVRDVAKKINRNVGMETIGEELDIDRNLVEILNEPLIHILRNSVHHGIEPEKERIKKGKNPVGEIILSAERRGNSIVISIKDDGKGIDEDSIIKKAVSKGLITKEKASIITKNEIYDLIFMPGFSTSEAVDKVSGRGVGMDIVKTSVTSARGKIEIKSEKDQFTEISLFFPLSMAIIDGMIVKVQDIFFVIPVLNIIESLQVNEDMIYSIKEGTKVIDLREEVIPVIELTDFFNIEKVHNHKRMLTVIIEDRENKYALLVDEIIAKKEIVIKPLSSKFKELKGISSGTILSGGKIGFIIDMDKIVEIKEE